MKSNCSRKTHYSTKYESFVFAITGKINLNNDNFHLLKLTVIAFVLDLIYKTSIVLQIKNQIDLSLSYIVKMSRIKILAYQNQIKIFIILQKT